MANPEERYSHQIGKRPADFDPEWAEVAIALHEKPPQPWFERTGVIIALIASLTGAITSCVNLSLFRDDRKARFEQQDLDNQASWARMYFEKVTVANDFCDIRHNANAFAQAARNAAAGRAEGMKALADIITSDATRRGASCGGRDINVAPRPGQVQNAPPPPPDVTTSYTMQQIAPRANAPASAGIYTVYIQFPRDVPVARGRANAMVEQVRSNATARRRFRLPGIEGVANVPGADQIRIYHATDEPAARELATMLDLEQATIVNLQTAYPNLPAGRMEIWLSQ